MSGTTRGRVTSIDVRGAVWSLVTTALGLGLAILVVDGVSISNDWAVLTSALVVGLGDVLLRPPLRLVARHAGAIGALVTGLGAQLLVAWIALTYVPGIHSESWRDVVLVLLVAGAFMAIGRWVVGSADSEYVLGDLIRRGRRRARRAGNVATSERGLLVVQLDGVSRATLDYALAAGLAPNLSRWLVTGTHVADSWWARVPATTPASQAGLLHGTSEHIPAFRWWDRAAGRLVVTNHPADAAMVEERMSDGAGLLSGGGAAISTMFSGDAATNLLVMSRARSGIGPGQMFVRFFSSPFVLVRALFGTIAEFCKELYQGWQQAHRGIEPRVSRLGWYPLLRAVTNVVLRDLNTSLVAEHLVAGTPVVFCDLVDYDEIAHHAGPLRPESMRSLEGLDRVVGLWERVAAVGGRRYDIVVLSDHGQALGATFETVTGRTLGAYVRELMRLPRVPGPVSGTATEAETWGAVNTALNSLGRSRDARVMVGPERGSGQEGEAAQLPEVSVIGSGNLGMIWFPRLDAVPDEEEVHALWPALIPGLLACPAVGVVVARRGAGAVVHGPTGTRDLDTGEVRGNDPLAGYPRRAAADLRRVAGLENAGDLILVSRVDEVGMVNAFEGLVGSHGGLGGDQNEAVLIHPVAWTIPDDELEDLGDGPVLVGAEAVYRRLVAWLVEAGIRPAGPSGGSGA